jgi:hypothetical protein
MPRRKKFIQDTEKLETIVDENMEKPEETPKEGVPMIRLKAKTNYRLFNGEMVKRDQIHDFTELEAQELLKKTNCWEMV